MKTQISNLRSGTKNQILNPEIDYSKLPSATSHEGHSGNNHLDVDSVWARIKAENPDKLKVNLKGTEVELTANWSLSGKSVTYSTGISKELLKEELSYNYMGRETPTLVIHDANRIMVTNGKNSYVYLCPSLIEIL